MRIKKAPCIELPSLDVLKLVEEIPAPLLCGIREHLGVDVPHKAQMLELQPFQAVVVEIDVYDSLQRDSGIDKRSVLCQSLGLDVNHCGQLFYPKEIDYGPENHPLAHRPLANPRC